MKYEGIAMVRIDDRLIHGQVMTSWLNFLGANKIMVIDDGVAVDPLVKNILKSCIPANIKLAVFTEDKAVERLKKGFAGDTVIVLVKYPKTLYSLMQKGIVFDEINIGGMGVSGNREKFFRNISASPEEKKMLKEMIDAGSSISVRIIAEDSATDISKLL
ncbi:MAG: PTS sugar transporter subunit IIB [Coriobacteriaceae bacterium]|nr:PTS sugar transporter subunit IIB [Coriobacteriaceae bacterium]